MAGFSTEMGRQKAPPKPGRGVRTIALDQRSLYFPGSGQQLAHSLPALQHSHQVWVALKQPTNLEQLQHLTGSLNDNDHHCRWRAFRLREVSDGAVVPG
jgi:hypothetical protein